MKSKIIFTLLLAVIIIIGVNGVDIAGKFFDDASVESATIDRNSIKSNALYIASPDEISFNPMEIINSETAIPLVSYLNSEATMNYEKAVYNANIYATIIKTLSGYCDTNKYKQAVGASLEDSLMKDGDEYIYVDKFEYLNTEDDKRYVSCIITSFDYSIVYLRFYGDNEKNLDSDDIENGLKRFREYSEIYYKDFYQENEEIDTLYDYSLEYYDENDDFEEKCSSIYSLFDKYTSENKYENPVKYFWVYSLLISAFDIDIKYYDEYSEENVDYTSNISSTGYLIDVLSTSSFNDDTLFIDQAEYVAYDGCIYQTMHFDISNVYNTIIVIYNIENNVIEGFYAPSNGYY